MIIKTEEFNDPKDIAMMLLTILKDYEQFKAIYMKYHAITQDSELMI